MSMRNYNVTKLRFSRHYFLIPIIFIVFILLFYLVYNDIKDKTISEFNNEQLLLAQAASQGITASFQNYQYELTFISQNKCTIDFNDDTKVLMASFYNNHKNLIEAVTRVDAGGKIIFTYPYNSSAIGQDISYQKHIHQVLTTHQTVISDVFMSVQGYLAVAMHVPVFKGQEFKGSIGILIQIDRLGKQYLEKIKLRGNGNAWLLSKNGIEIFCLIKGHTGKSFLDITQNDSSAIALMEKIKKKNKGTAKSIHAKDGFDGQTMFTEKYIVYYRVPLGSTYWTIIISFNEEEIYDALSSFRNRLVIIFSFLFIVMIYYFYSHTKVRTILNEEVKRKKTEKTLRDSEERFKKLFYDHSAVKLLIDSETGNIADANIAASKFYGWTIEELKTMKIFQINILPTDEVKKGMESARNKEKNYFEFKHRRADGSIRDVGVYSGLISDGGKNYLHSVIHDITSSKKNEKDLLEIQANISDLVEHTFDGILIANASGKHLFANQRMCEISGYSYEELMNLTIREMTPPDELEKYQEMYDKRLKGEKVSSQYERAFVRKDGKVIPVELRATTTIWNGEKCGLAFLTDITERKKAEEIQRENDELYRSLISNIPGMIYRAHMDWTADIISNSEEVCGYSISELSDHKVNWLDLILEEDKEIVFEQSSVLQEKPTNIIQEYRIVAKDKSIRWVSDHKISVFTPKGDFAGIDGIVYDITERKLSEEALKQSEIRYKQLFSDDLTGDFVISLDGTIELCNLAMAKIFGFNSVDELMKSNISEFYRNMEDREKLLDLIREKKKVERYEQEHITRDGRVISLIKNVIGEFDENGLLIRLKGYLFDDTERKRAEKALNESEKKFRSVWEKSTDGMRITNEEGVVLLANDAYCNLVEKPLKEIEGKPMSAVYQEIRLDEILSKHSKRFRSNTIPNYLETEITLWNGKRLNLELSNTFLEIENQPTLLLSVFRNITERKRAKEELQEKEQRYSTLFKVSPSGIVLADIDGVIIELNESFCKSVLYTRDELIGKNIRILVPTENHSDVEIHTKEILSGNIIEHVVKNIKKDGTLCDMELRESLVSLPDGRKGILTAVNDITERKLAEEKNIILANALKSVNECVSITDTENKFIFVNQSFLKTYGYTEDELIGKQLNIVRSQNNPSELVEQILPNTLRKGWQGELWNKRKDGSEFPIHLSTKAFNDKDGNHIGRIGVALDITERKLAEKELIKAKEKAEESNILKDAFIANMSHEIRTPLGGILGLSSIIKDLYAEHISQEDEELFAGIENSSRRIIRTVDMILNYSRIQTGEFPVSLKQLTLYSVCENLVREFRNATNNKLLKLSLESRCSKTTTIFGDEYSITNAISNLIDNAIKYTNKGFINVIIYKGNNDEVLLDIEDSGIGIGEEYINHIFDPYQQENVGYGRAYEGIGLGLSIVKKFLDLNNADIFVKSEKGKGSTFTINFGKALKASEEKINVKNTNVISDKLETTNKPLVLIVEDDSVNQMTIKIFLRNLYNTFIADSAERALEIIKNNKVDIILMDISIKGNKNGLELTKELKASKEYSKIPVIALTAHAFDTDRENSIKAGCEEYISKPFLKEVLLETIGRFL